MEDQIKQAEKIRSWSGVTCKIFSIFGVAGTIFYTILLPSDKLNKNEYLSNFLWVSIASSLSLAALGSIAESSKRNLALTSLMVKATNSASQIPINKEHEYSDLLEDTD